MTILNWQRFSILLLAVGMLTLGTSVSGQDKEPPREKGSEAKKDLHGDPLPEGARVRMGTLRWRHPAFIDFVGFTSKNKEVITGCADGYFRVWNAETGKEIRKFGKPAVAMPNGGQFLMRRGMRVVSYGMGSNVALSDDGKVLAEAGIDGSVRLWDVAGGKEIRTLGADPKKEKDWKGPIAIMRTPIGMSSVAFSPDGKALVTRGMDQVIRLWDTANGKEIRQMVKAPQQNQPGAFPAYIGSGNGKTLAFVGDGKRIVSADIELDNRRPAGVLRIYDVESGKELRQIKAGQQNFFMASGLTILPKTKTIAWAGTDGTIGLYDADSGKELRRVGKQQQNVFTRTLLVSPDGKVMATQITNGSAIHLWDVASGKELRTLGEQVQANRQGVLVGGFGLGGGMGSITIAFSSDGKTLAEATAGNTVRLWKVESGKEIAPRVSSGHHGDVNRLAVSADGKVLTTFAGDQTIRQWDMANGKELRQIPLPATNIGLSADGKLAAFNSGAKIHLWDVAQGKEIRAIDMPGQGQQQVIFLPMGMQGAPILSANGKWLALRGANQVLHVFDTATGKEHRQLVENDKPAPNPGGGGFVVMGFPFGNSPMAFSADGAAFAAVSATGGPILANPGGGAPMAPSSSLRLWNLALAKHPRLFETQQKTILELVVTPDGRYVASANADHSFSVWEALSGKECLHIKLKAPAAQPGLQPPQPPGGMVWGGGMPQASSISALTLSPNGRTLAAALNDSIHLWDLRTGKELGQFKGHKGTVVSVAFAPDNQTIVSGSADTTALVWDASKLIKKSATLDLKAQHVEELWKDLAGDPIKAYQAIATLSAAPKQSVDLFKKNIKPAAGGDEKRIQKLIGDLESDKFQVRQAATKELEKLGELVEHSLQKALQNLKALEAKRRVEKLLLQIANDQTPSADVVRTIRATQVLEQLSTPEARAELERLAKGAPGDKLTRSAQASLGRLGK